jgi:hypothetical protein
MAQNSMSETESSTVRKSRKEKHEQGQHVFEL